MSATTLVREEPFKDYLLVPDLFQIAEELIERRWCSTPRWQNFLTGNFVRCRRCEHCLRIRAWLWKQRMIREHNIWPRTWFVTLTYANTDNYHYKSVQDWLKRLRKAHNTPLRYVCTTEFESKGRREINPHHHVALYCEPSMHRRDIETQWNLGHSSCRLFKPKDAGYVAKYLVKGQERIRASNNIGNGKPVSNIPPF